MSIKIVTDSSITMDPKLAKALEITIVPLSVTIDGTTYSDRDLSFEDFMSKMAATKALPKTSQPPVGIFAEVYETIAKEDDEVISIHLTGALSGTVEAARQGGMLSGRNVTVLDSEFTDQALAFQVIEAARMAQAGKSKEEILAKITEIRQNTELYIGLATLENLVKGGRVSRMTGLFGSLLNVRVIADLKNYELNTLVRGRGNKTFYKWFDELAAQVSHSGRKVKEIAISHAHGLEVAQKAKEILQNLVENPISIMDTNSVLATHTGEGVWAIMIHYEA